MPPERNRDRPATAPARTSEHAPGTTAGIAAIIGAGEIGAGWAARFLLAGWEVRLFDPDPEARRGVAPLLAAARRTLPMLYETALPPEGRLTFCETISAAVEDPFWIQESLPERLALKRRTLQKIQQHCRADAVLASSSAGFSPSELQGCATRPGQIIAARPCAPVYLLPLVELAATAANPPTLLQRAEETLAGIGMFPLRPGFEDTPPLGDRLARALLREAQSMREEGHASADEIDDAIRCGIGLRWVLEGLSRSCPPSGAAPGTHGRCAPERARGENRDESLVALLRALKGRDAAAGAPIRKHESRLRPAHAGARAPLITVRRIVPIDWTDYNSHMNESRYGQVFSDAADKVMALIGADAAYIARGLSYFTVDIHIRFRAETLAGQMIRVETDVLEGTGKKLRLAHRMLDDDTGALLAEAEQLLIHVSLETRRSCEPPPEIAARAAALAAPPESG